MKYRWPGNVRQLRNVIDSAVVLAEEDEIRPCDLGLRDSGSEQLDSLKIEQWERKLICRSFETRGRQRPRSGQALGIGRATLYRKIEVYNIQR